MNFTSALLLNLRIPLTFLRLIITWVVLSGTLCIQACDEPDLVGANIQPAKDKISLAIDTTLKIISYTVIEDSLRSDDVSASLIGSYKDGVFGISTASVFTQCRLSSNNASFGTNPVLDSIVLSLVYDGFYGDTSFEQSFKVFELTEDIYKDSSYTSNRVFGYDQNEIASSDFYPSPKDSVSVEGANKTPHLRIKLSDNLGQKLLDQSGSSNLANNDAFLAFFKGLYITPANVSQNVDVGAILYFNLLSALSKLTLYYHNSTDFSLAFDFLINDYCARINHFTHDYSGVAVETQLNSPDSINGYNTVYVQAMAGVKSKILIPDIMNLAESGKIAINKAELIVELSQGTFGPYPQPDKMLVLKVDSLGKNDFLLDQFESHYNGKYQSSSYSYRFNITRHIQSILSGEKDYGMYLLPYGTVTSANRAIIEGNQNMKLYITYTRVN